MTYLLIFFISLILTIFITPYVINVLNKFGIIDRPGKRRVHEVSTPRMGGLILFGIIIIVLFGFYYDLENIRFFLTGIFIITVCGIYDDILGLSWGKKFILQFVAVFFLMLQFNMNINEVQIFYFSLPSPLNFFVFFIFILGVVNAFNLMDGMDGLVSGYSLLISLVLLALSLIKADNLITILSVGLVGCLLGILKYNAFPAKIFLGDTGSLLLGYVLVFLSLKTSINFKPYVADLTFPIILLSVPIIDTLKVMFARVAKNSNPFLPDKSHLHHILYESRIRHKTTVFFIQIINIIFIFIALNYIRYNQQYLPIFYLVSVGLLLNTKKIVAWARSIEMLKTAFGKLIESSADLITFYKKVFLWISYLAAASILITSLSLKSIISFNELSVFVIIGIVLLGVSIFHNSRTKEINNFYVFLNFSAFFLINNSELLWSDSGSIYILVSSKPVFIASSFILLIFIAFFLVLREKIISKSEIFLTGMDLTIIAAIGLIFVLQNFVIYKSISPLSESLFYGYFIYMWYKIVTVITPKLKPKIFYSTFLIPFLTLLLIWLGAK